MKNVIIKGYAGAFHRNDLVVSAIDYDRLQSLVTELEKDKAKLQQEHTCYVSSYSFHNDFVYKLQADFNASMEQSK